MEAFFPYSLALMFTLLALPCSATRDLDLSRKPHSWTKLILTHHWPKTVCEMDQVQCDAPSYWTLHGLWPDKSQMCNNSWPFDYSEIQDIAEEMNKCWPDVIHPNRTQLWKHEWQKHGTCAASLDALNSQHKYFSKGLELYKQVDLTSTLEKSGIVPSTKYYQMKDILAAITNMYGVMPKIQCLPPQQNEDAQTLGQIEICFCKDFQLTNCSHKVDAFPFSFEKSSFYAGLQVCSLDLNTLYPPINSL